MALQALGSKISSALQRLVRTESVDDDAVKAALKEIAGALLEADVNINLVSQLRKNVLARVGTDDGPAVSDKAKLVERCVIAELVQMLDPQKPAFKPKKGKSNVVMFVGLQGAGKTTTVAKCVTTCTKGPMFRSTSSAAPPPPLPMQVCALLPVPKVEGCDGLRGHFSCRCI